MKFYFVDDDKNIRTILKILVTERNLGECCGSSGNGDDALEDVAALHPDIIIVDLLMPDMDGISFVEKARKISPCLLYTSGTIESDSKRLVQRGRKLFNWCL